MVVNIAKTCVNKLASGVQATPFSIHSENIIKLTQVIEVFVQDLVAATIARMVENVIMIGSVNVAGFRRQPIDDVLNIHVVFRVLFRRLDHERALMGPYVSTLCKQI